MIFHCPTCGDVIDVPDAKLPYSGNCPFCAAPVRLDAAKAIDREAEAPPTPPPAPARPVPPPPRVTPTPPRHAHGKMSGIVILVVIVIIAAIARTSFRKSRKPKPPTLPQIQIPKFDYNYTCLFCDGTTGKADCRVCDVECPRCGKKRSVADPSCSLCRRTCLTCRGTGKMDCPFCASRRRSPSRHPEIPPPK